MEPQELVASGAAAEGARRFQVLADASEDPAVAETLYREAAVAAIAVDEHQYAAQLLALAVEADPPPRPTTAFLRAALAARLAAVPPPRPPQLAVEDLDEPETGALLTAVDLAVPAFDPHPGFAIAEAVVSRARAGASDSLLARALHTRGMMASHDFGDWRRARGDLIESARISRRTGDRTLRSASLFTLAFMDAAQGRERLCRRRLATAVELAGDGPAPRPYTFQHIVLGDLELTMGRPEAALREIGLGLADVQPPSSRGQIALIEAYVLAGRIRDARLALERFERRVEHDDRPAGAWRVRGLVAPADEYDAIFAEVLAGRMHPYDRARTELLYGERLRRDNRRSDARAHLRAAVEGFDELRARPWAERARRELAATGEHVGRAAGELTPQERRVAEIVAEGATNKEVAAHLVVSENTVEFHLKNVFRKLDVRSRAELVHRLADPV